jgi:hypothetical protein
VVAPIATAQSPRAANPERPTFATHAYVVAPGYVELEQGLSARGTSSLREETSWDVNVKFGVSPHAQVALFGPLYARALGGLTAVMSADLPTGVHVDANTGPQGIGAGTPQWFLSLSGSRAFGGSVGATVELFRFSSGGAGPQLAGLLGAVTLRFAEWGVVDVGGSVPIATGTPDQVFVGLTSNLGRLF